MEIWNKYIEIIKEYTEDSKNKLDTSKLLLEKSIETFSILEQSMEWIFKSCDEQISVKIKAKLEKSKREINEIISWLSKISEESLENMDKIDDWLMKIQSFIKTQYENNSKDNLTGLFNWESLNNRIDILLKEKKDFNMVYIDLDWLWNTNNKYWHLAWDELLKEFAKSLRLMFWDNKNDLFRKHGDEFQVLSYESTTDLFRKFEKLDIWFQNKDLVIQIWDKNINLGTIKFSYWIIQWLYFTNKVDLLNAADQEMYKMKKKRKTS